MKSGAAKRRSARLQISSRALSFPFPFSRADTPRRHRARSPARGEYRRVVAAAAGER